MLGFQLVMGWAEYRAGEFASTVDWTQKVVAKSGKSSLRDVEAMMILAMARHRAQQFSEAGAALADGVNIADTKLPKLDGGDIGCLWIDWLIAHELMREAKALIEGTTK